MILIFTVSTDVASNQVIAELHSRGRKVARINADVIDESLKLSADSDDIHISCDNFSTSLNKVTSAWYRKGPFVFRGLYKAVDEFDDNSVNECVSDSVTAEANVAVDFFHKMLYRRSRTLGNSEIGRLNKLFVNLMASEVGLKIPNFLLSNEKSRLLDFFEKEEFVVTKAISDAVYFWDFESTKKAYISYTEKVDAECAAQLPDAFSPSYLQRGIKKSFEVRSFYLDGDFYSVALLSQQDEATEIDYRKYNDSRPTRTLPISIPTDISEKLKQLFARIELNTGSVDMIVDVKDEWYFLEINPSGQYGNVAINLGINLSGRIAEWLSK